MILIYFKKYYSNFFINILGIFFTFLLNRDELKFMFSNENNKKLGNMKHFAYIRRTEAQELDNFFSLSQNFSK